MGLAAAAALAVALPPALASMSRAERIRDTQLSETLLSQFTPASGDPRLIARYKRMSAEARESFSFTPAVTDQERKNRAITVVIRAREDAARSTGLAAVRAKPSVAIAPIAYDLGASVGFEKFVTPSIPRGMDIKNLPVAKAPDQEEKKSRFATRMISRPSEPAGATDRVTSPGNDQAVDVVSSYRLTKNLDVTAGVRYRSDAPVEPLTDTRRDSQAVYVGTAFRF
ncbi:hypothetical protein [Sphingopyxis sp. MWB1]|uniref:hypothetical protein n=1 Tax=Sphingopyxis sp. MWB1 TaxID=1537715 RepID=UPI00051A28E3|nr:hypothetical protein [Sphingopyxis sp. MWB1]